MQENVSSSAVTEAALQLRLRLNVWTAAAVVLRADDQAPEAVRVAARALLGTPLSAAIANTADLGFIGGTASASAELTQAAAAVLAHGRWESMADHALVAQGESSARGARMFGPSLLPHLRGLQESLDAPGARMLDIGTGVGALATYYAEQFPSLSVVGLDISERVLKLARSRAETSDVSERLTFQLGNVAELQEEAAYDFVWFPTPFIPDAVVEAGIIAATRALKPGGWLLLGHQQTPDADEARSVLALQNAIFGGSALNRSAVIALVEGAGLPELQGFDFPAPAPAFLAARKPE